MLGPCFQTSRLYPLKHNAYIRCQSDLNFYDVLIVYVFPVSNLFTGKFMVKDSDISDGSKLRLSAKASSDSSSRLQNTRCALAC